MVFDHKLVESWDRADAVDRWRPREYDLDAVRPHAGELIQLPDGREVAVPHDRYAIADMLDLGEDMRRDEDRRAVAAGVTNQPVELLLVQRIEPARRLVEDEQGGLRRKREKERQLLLVAVRVLAVLATEIEVETFRDGLDLAVGL